MMLDPEDVAALAAEAQLDEATTAAVVAMSERARGDVLLQPLAERLPNALLVGPRGAAIAELAERRLETVIGRDAYVFYMLLALLELPAARERHALWKVPAQISRDTWRDLALWARHAKAFGYVGMTLEVLDWAQHYLRGNLMRFGPVEFELCPFDGPIVIYRHRRTGELRALAIPGKTFDHGGRLLAGAHADAFVASGSLDALTGHPIDPVASLARRETVTLDANEWERFIEPGTPLIEQHTPADARIRLIDFVHAAQAAMNEFARIFPDVKPRGVFGEAWLLDPQMHTLMPKSGRLDEFRNACFLYPSRIPEAKTIRRVFGPDATRASVVDAPRDEMNILQRRIADFLREPANALCSAGAFMSRERVDELAAAAKVA
jgi:hypothetical protein